MPFENINDPLFFYYSPKHKEALARMIYAVRQRKLGALLVGEYGTGKTFLSSVLKKVSLESKYTFVFITNPRLSSLEFIQEVYYQLGGRLDLSENPSRVDFLHFIKKSLEENHKRNMHTVIVIDEAQSIKEQDFFEELRLLLNFQNEEAVFSTLILLGQPPLGDNVKKVPQLKQRLAIRYHLAPLNEEETKDYIGHRLKVAGAKRKLFSDNAYKDIFSLSKGMPRAINNICDLALFSGFSRKLDIVDKETIINAGQDLGEVN